MNIVIINYVYFDVTLKGINFCHIKLYIKMLKNIVDNLNLIIKTKLFELVINFSISFSIVIIRLIIIIHIASY